MSSGLSTESEEPLLKRSEWIEDEEANGKETRNMNSGINIDDGKENLWFLIFLAFSIIGVHRLQISGSLGDLFISPVAAPQNAQLVID